MALQTAQNRHVAVEVEASQQTQPIKQVVGVIFAIVTRHGRWLKTQFALLVQIIHRLMLSISQAITSIMVRRKNGFVCKKCNLIKRNAGIWETTVQGNIQIWDRFYGLVRQVFAGVPVYMVLGNHEGEVN